MQDDDELFGALDELVDALRENGVRNEAIIERAERLRRLRNEGATWTELVTEQERPLIVELLSQNMALLTGSGSKLRRLEAQALYNEGISMERIAKLFGVTRQRISELLRSIPARQDQ